METFLLEKMNVKKFADPVDGSTANVVGGRVDMSKQTRVCFLLLVGAGAGTVVLNLKQHNAASAGTTKALSVANLYYHKVAAATSFTKVEPTVASDIVDVSAAFAANSGLLAVEVLQEDLDVNGGFTHFSVELVDTGAVAKLVSGLYLCHDVKAMPAYATAL